MRETIERVIAGVKDKETNHYARDLWKEADTATKAGDVEHAKSLLHLGDACSMRLRSDDVAQPFGPMATLGTKSTAQPDSVDEDMIATLRNFVDEKTDPELRARCADLLWVVKRDYNMAVIAIDAYLESAQSLHSPGSWVAPMHRIERAYRLAAMLNHKEGFNKASAYAKKLLVEFDGKDPLYFSEKLLALLAERRDGDPKQYAELAERAARHAQAQSDHHKAQALWKVAATWRRLGKDEGGASTAALEGAREHVLLADQARAAGSHHNEAAHLSDAVTALKRARAPASEVEAIHKRLLSVQPEARKHMGGFALTIPLGETPRQAQAAVSKKSLYEALNILAALTKPPTLAGLKAQVEEERKRHPLVHLFHKSYINESGKVIAKAPGASLSDKDEDAEALHAAMAKNRYFHHGLTAAGIINPARDTILLEHPVRPRDFAPLLESHPFVPPGHVRAWAEALHAGLTGDLETAAHYLAPQMEASIRFLLETNGAIVSAHNDEGIQEELPLNRLLDMPELMKVFGADVVADLKFVFVDRYGLNLRNRVGHGLATDDELSSTMVLYAWWLSLRIIMSAIELATPAPEPNTITPEPELREVKSGAESDESDS